LLRQTASTARVSTNEEDSVSLPGFPWEAQVTPVKIEANGA
jgi:hypothetical protein